MQRPAAGAARVGALLAAVAAVVEATYYEADTIYEVFAHVDCGEFTYERGCSCSAPLNGARVLVTPETCKVGYDILSPPGDDVLARLGIEAVWRYTECSLTYIGTDSVGTLRSYSEAIAATTWRTNLQDGGMRTIRYELGAGRYLPSTRHFYQRFSFYDETLPVYPGHEAHTWQEATWFCAHPDRDVLGMVGYLATVTSSAENEFLKSINGEGFYGASDVGEEGQWKWVTGPEGCQPYDTDPSVDPYFRSTCNFGKMEKNVTTECVGTQCTGGRLFWVAPADPNEAGYGQGVGEFTSWNADEPLRTDGYDFLHAWGTNMKWNTYPIFNDAMVGGFVCEWGGVGRLCIAPSELVGEVDMTHNVDECDLACATCEMGLCAEADQECVDPNPDAASLSDWQCLCAAPLSGTGLQEPAVCVLDECRTGGGQACMLDGQYCVDPNQSPNRTDDFECACVYPEVGFAIGSRAACVLDECVSKGKLYCYDHGQTCYDPDQTAASLYDFICTCPPPSQGHAKGRTAVCMQDECVAGGGREQCVARGQSCEDRDPSVGAWGDYICRCNGPGQSGTAEGGAAVCYMNECDAEPCGSGQTCVDPNTLLGSVNDYICTCASLYVGQAIGRPATCTPRPVDECEVDATHCLEAGQACVEPDVRVLGDAYCMCPLPGTGMRVGGPVEDCSFDECTRHGRVCRAAAQECVDVDTQTLHNWECRCAPPQRGGPARRTPALCVYEGGDCEGYGFVCTAAGQQCHEEDTGAPDGRWSCVCPTYATGAPGQQQPAACTLDECDVACPSCGLSACPAGQKCVDPDTSAAATHDWECRCVAPAAGTAVGRAATCALDECTETCATCADAGGLVGNVCRDAGQLCVEHSVHVLKDWVCRCLPNGVGEARAAVASCSYNECHRNEHICLVAGQSCVDANSSRHSVDDWMCVCGAHYDDSHGGLMEPAACYVDECTTERDVCSAVGQDCFDMDFSTYGTFECRCRAPSQGVAALGPVGACVLDECRTVCPSCAANTTGTANTCSRATPPQECEDLDTAAESLSDWVCLCAVASTGQAFTAPVARCRERNECVDESSAVLSGRHIGRYTVGGCLCAVGWVVDCTPGTPGCGGRGAPYSPTTNPSGGPCESGCCDPDGRGSKHGWCRVAEHPFNLGKTGCNPTSLGLTSWAEVDGACMRTGMLPIDGGVGRGAPGLRDSFPLIPDDQNNVCTDFQQLCIDPRLDVADDWQCRCVAPSEGWAGQTVANCTRDECVAHGWLCAEQEPPQTCHDVNPSVENTGDWECRCALGEPLAAQVGPAACALDECTTSCATCAVVDGANYCERANQTCEDPRPTPQHTNDWICRCAWGSPRAATAATATCEHDECELICPTCARTSLNDTNTCTAVRQVCEDTHTGRSQLADWRCLCPLPSTSAAVAGPAVCAYDECGRYEGNCTVPSGNTQRCVDDDFFEEGTWRCECVPPARGDAVVGGLADCHVDECVVHGFECERGGQLCIDPNVTQTGDWVCRCSGDDFGVDGQQWRAACNSEGECKKSYGYCHNSRQACVNNVTEGEWQCECIPPLKGTPAIRSSALCLFDECTEVCFTCQQHADDVDPLCTAADQDCVEPNRGLLRDWFCDCRAPQDRAPLAYRNLMDLQDCVLDECVADCETCAGSDCAEADPPQSCYDPGTHPQDVSNWECRCVDINGKAAHGAATLRPADACRPSTTCDFFENPCAARGQLCIDATGDAGAFNAEVDFACACPAPYSGFAYGRPVATCDVVDECAVRGVAVNSTVCAEQGQRCVDVDVKTLGTWYCECTRGTGRALQAYVPATECYLDECVEVCETCAPINAEGVNVCETEGQTCVEGNKNVKYLGDWMCRCPVVGGLAPTEQLQGLATCGNVDECAPRSLATLLCASANQRCRDSDRSAPGTFVCYCPHPQEGERTGGVAACTLDECSIEANRRTCTDVEVLPGASQRCYDQSVDAVNDWVCICPAPSSGMRLGTSGAAVCTYDECHEHAGECEAATPPQMCRDADTTRTGDWQCECVPPLDGLRTGGPAACALDECVAPCTGCADGLCERAGQTCVDANTHPEALRDWVCGCPPPSTATAVASLAVCLYDECYDHGGRCLDVSPPQRCEDPNWSLRGDWQCHCPSPMKGSARGRPAVCTRDECRLYGIVCAAKGQMCVDLDLGATASGSWMCRCPDLAVNQTQRYAACNHDADASECGNPTVAERCAVAGQTCYDPTGLATLGDWYCACVHPSVGEPRQGAAADCLLDECAASCSTCAGTVCADAGQECIDDAQGPSKLNSWQCHCVAPAFGTPARGAPATCAEDECETRGEACTAVGQMCRDVDEAEAGTWMCVCQDPEVGQALAAPAVCILDECGTAAAGVCFAAGQYCVDRNTAAVARGDWECVCPPPSRDQAVAAAVPTCTVDECTLYGGVCESAAQVCVDDNFATRGTWGCRCDDDEYSPTQPLAPHDVCAYDECLAVGNAICANATPPQMCNDPTKSHSLRNDWTCACADDPMITAVGAPAVCYFEDECLRADVAAVCASGRGNQTCHDVDWRTRGNWVCRCDHPARGEVVAGAASCPVDECAYHFQECTPSDQHCVDPSVDVNGDWRCVCRDNTTYRTGGYVPVCPRPAGSPCTEEAEIQCASVGKVCEERTTGGPTYACVCPAPTYPVRRDSKIICKLDECTTDCPSCAGSLCADAGQTCHDQHAFLWSLYDWLCTCAPPARGSRLTGVAACTINECDPAQECGTCARGTCVAADQDCTDPNTDARAVGDWTCSCKDPPYAARVAHAATCVVDECLTHDVCAPHACSDPHPTSDHRDDWVCVCPTGTTGTRVHAPPRCESNECHKEANAGVCARAGQRCRDPNPAADSLGDWQCVCTAGPSVGEQAAARCGLDECVDVCATCADSGAGNMCTRVGQECVDPTKGDPLTVGDWFCRCVGGGAAADAVTAVGEPARCAVDECSIPTNFGAVTCRHATRFTVDGCVCDCAWTDPSLDGFGPGKDAPCMSGCCNPDGRARPYCRINRASGANPSTDACQREVGYCTPPEPAERNVCTDVDQTCTDPNTAPHAVLDWMCECDGLSVGAPEVGGVADCKLDECILHENVCASATPPQMCVDTLQDTMDDWECRCYSGASGEPVRTGATICVYDGECLDDTVCTAANQLCYDANPTILGNWACQCTPPSRGTPRRGGAATCVLDECHTRCATCAGDTCSAAQQLCEDLNPDATSLGDWVCACREGSPTALRTPATCPVDECITNGAACVRAKQNCIDPDHTQSNDWRCLCKKPQVTIDSPAGMAAVCALNECLRHSVVSTCTAAGQKCEDPDLNEAGTWVCVCIGSGAVGQQQVAPCDVTPGGWCAQNPGACGVGQVCTDPGVCHCVAPLVGSATNAPASCRLDECLAVCSTCADDGAGNICDAAGQDCHDPNPSPEQTNDWLCTCGNGVTARGAHAIADCSYQNECVTHGYVCAAASPGPQVCRDADTRPDRLGDWYCQCPRGAIGDPGMAAAANCTWPGVAPRPPPTAMPATSFAPETRAPDADGAGGESSGHVCLFMDCFWWVLVAWVFLLLMCMRCAIVLFKRLAERRRREQQSNESLMAAGGGGDAHAERGSGGEDDAQEMAEHEGSDDGGDGGGRSRSGSYVAPRLPAADEVDVADASAQELVDEPATAGGTVAVEEVPVADEGAGAEDDDLQAPLVAERSFHPEPEEPVPAPAPESPTAGVVADAVAADDVGVDVADQDEDEDVDEDEDAVLVPRQPSVVSAGSVQSAGSADTGPLVVE